MLPDSRRPRRFAIVMSATIARAMATPNGASDGIAAIDLLARRRDRHRDREDVVDEQRRRRDERGAAAEVRLRDGVRAAAGRVGDADLAIADRDDREQEGDRDRDRQGHAERRDADPPEEQRAEDLLCRIRARADRVGAEDRKRLRLGQSLADLLVARERPPEQRPSQGRHRAAEGPLLLVRLRARDQGVRGRVTEVLALRPLDADAPVARLAALQLGVRGRALRDALRVRPRPRARGLRSARLWVLHR